MTDFPTIAQLPLFVSTISAQSCLAALAATGTSISPAALTWVANQAVYMPVTLPWPYPVNRVWWINGSTVTSTNVDFGIYTASGAQLYHTGSTAMAGASNVQFVTPATPFVLPAGRYFFAWVCDNTTTRAFGVTPSSAATGALSGLLTQTSALPLPTTATFATFSAVALEVCGITRTAVGSAF